MKTLAQLYPRIERRVHVLNAIGKPIFFLTHGIGADLQTEDIAAREEVWRTNRPSSIDPYAFFKDAVEDSFEVTVIVANDGTFFDVKD